MPYVAPPVGYEMPSVGVRFNDARFGSHMSMSSLGSTARSSNDQWENYSRQQIYKKVNVWFSEWRPWQQRMLLCGLTNRCSTSQLESLATTLEPLFHRDFVTSLRKRYPSAPFRRQKARQIKKEATQKNCFKQYARKLVEELVEKALELCPEVPKEDESKEDGAEKNVDKVEEPKVGDESTVTDIKNDATGDELAKDETDQVLEIKDQKLESINEENPTATEELTEKEGEEGQIEKNDANELKEAEVSDDLAGEVDKCKSGEFDGEEGKSGEEGIEGKEAVEEDREKDSKEGEGTKDGEKGKDVEESKEVEEGKDEEGKEGEEGKEVEEDKEGEEGKEEEGKEEEGNEQLEVNLDYIRQQLDSDDEEDELLFVKTTPKFDGPRKLFISRPFMTAFDYAGRDKTESGLPSIKDNLGLLLSRQYISMENRQNICQSYPQSSPLGPRMHRHRSGLRTADVRATDFFERRMSKLGPLQAQLRTGCVYRPSRVGDVDAPVQKLFKHSKFWGSNPKEGKTFVRPKKAHLKWHFREQVKRVWEWICDWEEWEKLNLLANIVKLCDQDLLNYLTQCMIERLRERVDISWLSDPLLILIFSYLPTSDIESASRVCRRWRYLTSTNELWMIKCQEFGMDQGIPNILDLVKASGMRGQDIDWRLAYLELQSITEQAKSSLPIPSRLAFQGPTPVGMRRIGGKFISAIAPERLQRKPTAQSQDSRLSTSAGAGQTYVKGRGIAKPPDEITVDQELEGLRPVGEIPVSSPHTSFPSRGVSRIQPEAISPMKSERPLISGGGRRQSKVSAQTKIDLQQPLEEKATKVQRPIRKGGKKKPDDEDDDDEPAKDVRPQLVQAKDVLIKTTIASKMWSDEDAKEARERLESYVSKVAPIKRVRKLQGHMDTILCIELDTRRLISGSMDRAIRIWDIRSGRSLHKFYGHKGGVTCLKFDDKTLYSGSWDTALMVWDLVNFERIEVLTGHGGTISCLAMNDDFVFSGSHDGTVRVWGRLGLKCKKILDHHTAAVLCMDLSGPHVVSGSTDRTIRITEFLTNICIRVIRAPRPVETLRVSGSLIMTGDVVGHLYVWNLGTGKAEVGIQAHDAAINCVVYHSNHIFTASSDSTIKQWDLMTMACVRSLEGHKGAVRDFKVSNKCMVSAGADGHVRVWDKVIPQFCMGEDQKGFQLIDEREK